MSARNQSAFGCVPHAGSQTFVVVFLYQTPKTLSSVACELNQFAVEFGINLTAPWKVTDASFAAHLAASSS